MSTEDFLTSYCANVLTNLEENFTYTNDLGKDLLAPKMHIRRVVVNTGVLAHHFEDFPGYNDTTTLPVVNDFVNPDDVRKLFESTLNWIKTNSNGRSYFYEGFEKTVSKGVEQYQIFWGS